MKRLAINLFLSLLILTGWTFHINAQTDKLDSLRNLYSQTSNTERQQTLLLLMCEENSSLPADSLIKYILELRKLYKSDSPNYFLTENYYCLYLIKEGKYSQAIDLSKQLINKYSATDIHKTDFCITLSLSYIRNTQNKEALEAGFTALQNAEASKDTLSILKSYRIIGLANMEVEKYDEAIRWFNKAFIFSQNKALLSGIVSLYSNAASCYNNISKLDTAMILVNMALQLSRQTENLTVEANSLNIRAAIYQGLGKLREAEEDLKTALEIRKKIGGSLYIIADMAQLAFFYADINSTDKGIDVAKEGIKIARTIDNKSKLVFLYKSLAYNYQKAGMDKEFGLTLEKLMEIKDSVNAISSADAIDALETKFELQKKENIILQQEAKITRNRYVTIFGIVFMVFGLLLSYFVYKNYQHKQQLRMEKAVAEQKQLATEAVQQAEENERKRIAADLHDNLGSYAAAISANVKYIQEGNNSRDLTNQLEENAQSMVTQLSDTIWILKNEQLNITKLADRYKVWMQRLLQNFPDVKYFYSEDIENEIEFSPAQVLDLFLILKECVNNALRHSACNEIVVRFESKKQLTISIDDNGKGFKTENIRKGSGIDNILSRAKAGNFHVKWNQNLNGGTVVTIESSTTN